MTIFTDPNPVASDDFTDTDYLTAVTVDVLANDTAGERATIEPDTLVIVDPVNLSLTTKHLVVARVGTYDVVESDGSARGQITFTPDAGFSGVAVNAYEISQRRIQSDVAARAPAVQKARANLTITVAPGPSAPPTSDPPATDPPATHPPDTDPPTTPGSGNDGLAHTGGPSAGGLGLGVLLGLVGWALLLVRRRRQKIGERPPYRR